MDILGSIVKTVRFEWRGNKSKKTLQKGEGPKVHVEQGVSNIHEFKGPISVFQIISLGATNENLSAKELLSSAADRFISEQAFIQQNLHDTIKKAELDKIEDPGEVGKDWFFKWMKTAEDVSDEDMQSMLASILSDEVKAPKSFSTRTLEVVKNLSKEELTLFQKFCDISYSLDLNRLVIEGSPSRDLVATVIDRTVGVIAAPYGSPGNNGLKSLGLDYAALCMLQDAGLIQKDLTSWRPMSQRYLMMPFKIGAKSIELKKVETKEPDPDTNISILNLTEAGRQIRSVMTLGVNEEYIEKLLTWTENVFKLK